jgi:Fe-S-cluster-containing dehydrogenase component
VQRISRAKIDTKNETGYSKKPADGSVKTACQQACPAGAITFGDLTDSNSIVSRTKRINRNYMMLEELNVRPRTSYLAKIRNPNPNMA